MIIRRRALTVSGAFLAALLAFTADAVAQTAPVEVTLHRFSPASPDGGGNPYAGVIIGRDGTLYGTTRIGGTAGHGTVFSLTPPEAPGGGWTEAVLHSFAGGTSDGEEAGALVIGRDGVLYGTTFSGGNWGGGTVFALAPPVLPDGAWTETVLHNFGNYDAADGSYPDAGLSIGEGGVLYGTTLGGGASVLYGTAFSLTPPTSRGGEWREAVLYNFSGSDGSGPTSSLAIGEGGVLYGTTLYGGAGPCEGFAPGCGVVFSLTPPTSVGGAWTEAVLHNFTGIPDGAVPAGGVTIGRGGVLYGTTENGGNYTCGGNLGCGTAFAVTPPTAPGGSWTEAVLYNFGDSGRAIDGLDAQGSLAIGRGGVLYGTTLNGGDMSGGMVFSLAPPASTGGSWTRTVLYMFPSPSSGEGCPYAGVVIGRGGILYGTTFGASNTDTGTVFALKP